MQGILEYILENYSSAQKIVEVGVGRYTEVLTKLREKLDAEVIGVDIEDLEGIEKDDIFNPRLEIYRGADLIYALRPEPELYSALKRLAQAVKADLIIRPFSGDCCLDLEGFKLLNYSGDFFYVLKW